ncbi:MAG: hypothetical protein JKX92_07090 [Porticoccaceae bacterium]|nr:hypothetical protein [Porticoccaceae bacterium]
MLKKLFSRKKPTSERQLHCPSQLLVGDMISLKYRDSLPQELREQSLEVIKVGTYEFASGTSKEVVLKDAHNQLYFMGIDNEDGKISLCFARKIPRQQLFTFIEEDSFAQLWSQDWPELIVENPPKELTDWLSPRYQQSIKEQEAYYYDRDCQGQDLSAAEDGEELRIHECEGSDDHYGIGVEISGDGSTEIFLQVYCVVDVIEQMWPRNTAGSHGD